MPPIAPQQRSVTSFWQQAWQHRPSARGALDAVDQLGEAPRRLREARDAFMGRAPSRQTRAQTLRTEAAEGSRARWSGGNLALRGLRTARTGMVAAGLPSELGRAGGDLYRFARSGSRADFDRMVGSTATAARDTLDVASQGATAWRDGARLWRPYAAARDAFRASAPAAPAAARRVAARVARDTFQNVRAPLMEARARTVSRTAEPAVRRNVAEMAATRASRAGRNAALHALRGPAARIAGRFVPGANVVMAGLDVARAYSDLRDPEASPGRRITSVITALGSLASATNIPILSQGGAAVATVSSIAGAFFE